MRGVGFRAKSHYLYYTPYSKLCQVFSVVGGARCALKMYLAEWGGLACRAMGVAGLVAHATRWIGTGVGGVAWHWFLHRPPVEEFVCETRPTVRFVPGLKCGLCRGRDVYVFVSWLVFAFDVGSGSTVRSEACRDCYCSEL